MLVTDVFISLLKGKLQDKIALLEKGIKSKDLLDLSDSELKNRYKLEKGKRLSEFNDIIKVIDKLKIKVINILDDNYPQRLKQIFNPPFLLYVRGDVNNLKNDMVSIVGTRKPTLKGYYGGYQLGLDLGKSSVSVVSGLALGIDASAHEGNITSGGKTIAVLGNGIDSVYPKSNRSLGAKILESGGTILSEFPPGEEVRPYNFPKRNRIVAGLADKIIIIQAPKKSGSLITGDMALENGGDVYVHSSGVGDSKFLGSDKYHRDGALKIDRGFPVLKSLGKEFFTEDFNQNDFSDTQLLQMELEGKVVKYRGKYFYL